MIPVYNGAEYVGEAVASVVAQAGVEVECVVVDDGSTDGSGDVAAAIDPSVKVLRTGNGGVSHARNHGAAATRHGLIAFLDADDRWDPERLAECLRALAADEDAHAVLCSMRLVDPDGDSLGHLRAEVPPTPASMLMREISFPPSSSCILARRQTFDRIGGFEPTLSTSADWDLTLRIAEAGRVTCVGKELVTYTVRENSMSSDISLMARDMRHAYQRAFARNGRDRAFRRRAWSRMFRMLAGSHFDTDRDPRAFGYAALSMGLDPRTASETLGASFSRLRGHHLGRNAPYV